MLIGELAQRSGFSRDTIRYYEKLGLLDSSHAQRSQHGAYKNYLPRALQRLSHVQRLKDAGFTLTEIHALLTHDGPESACRDLPDRLAKKIGQIERQLTALSDFKSELQQIQSLCNGACGTSDGLPDCAATSAKAPSSSGCC